MASGDVDIRSVEEVLDGLSGPRPGCSGVLVQEPFVVSKLPAVYTTHKIHVYHALFPSFFNLFRLHSWVINIDVED